MICFSWIKSDQNISVDVTVARTKQRLSTATGLAICHKVTAICTLERNQTESENLATCHIL